MTKQAKCLKVLTLIDSLAPGGAQRQFVSLISVLSERGYDVQVLYYHRLDFYRDYLDGLANVSVRPQFGRNKVIRAIRVLRFLCSDRYDVIVSFLDTPNYLVQVAKLFRLTAAKTISSERIASIGESYFSSVIRKFLLSRSNNIVCNSLAQKNYLLSLGLDSSKLTVIHNMVEAPFWRETETRKHLASSVLRVLVVGSYIKRKRPLVVIEAARIFLEKNKDLNLPGLEVRFYGQIHQAPNVEYQEYSWAVEKIKKDNLSNVVFLNDVIRDVYKLYPEFDVLCLVSESEGCANVICEAMAGGLPVIASRVGDNDLFVEDGKTGFLVPLDNPVELAEAFRKVAGLTKIEKKNMENNCFVVASRNFSRQQYAKNWIEAIEAEL